MILLDKELIFSKLKQATGMNQLDMIKNKVLSSETMRSIRHNNPITTKTINKISNITKMDPSEYMKWVPDEEEQK